MRRSEGEVKHGSAIMLMVVVVIGVGAEEQRREQQGQIDCGDAEEREIERNQN